MNTCIALVFDSGYRDQAAVFIQSFAENYSGTIPYDIVCIVPREHIDDIALTLPKMLVLPITLNLIFKEPKIPKNINLANIISSHWGTNTSWYRLYLGSTLKNYDRVFLFDADMLVVQNIQPILDTKQSSPFMASFDAHRFIHMRGVRYGVWFNAGFFIADLRWWRKSKIEKKFSKKLKSGIITAGIDDDMLNEVVRHIWKPLPLAFNFYYFDTNLDESYLRDHHREAIILHFFGKDKPWNCDDGSLIGEYWRRCRRELLCRLGH